MREWHEKVFDKTDSAHRDAYGQLRQAYDITKLWAVALRARLFPHGSTKTIRRPIDQWNRKFVAYNWSRIYPYADAPRGLAYTIGIDAVDGFVVKIDLVDAKIHDPSMRKRYDEIRGLYNNSPIVALMSAEEGLKLGLEGIVAWSAAAIENFGIGYDDVAAQLGLIRSPNVANVLGHFQRCKDFRERQPGWSNELTRLFARFATAVHELGFDWWSTKNTNAQLVFGGKEKNAIRGSTIGALFVRQGGVEVRWVAFSGLKRVRENQLLNQQLVELVEGAATRNNDKSTKRGQRSNRIGFWPDQYGSEEAVDMENRTILDGDDLSESSVITRNQIYYGPPGTGKTWTLQDLLRSKYTAAGGEERFEFVTFHQSYGYEEFVEGLRPVIFDSTDEQADDVSRGDVRYEIKQGAFLRLCERARKDPTHQYAMVIDEINRGNISKIFGELITLIELDKREGARNPVTLTLPYSGKPFSVPLNVDVIGTMNTADRSLALVDTALRRRFEFIERMPDPGVLQDITVFKDDHEISLKYLLGALNMRIEALYDREHTIGHAYFTPLEQVSTELRFDALATIFRTRIIPLLEEYFFDDWQKIWLVLGDNQKEDPEFQFVKRLASDTGFTDLFGSNDEWDEHSLRPRYCLNVEVFDQPQAYIGIYSTLPKTAFE
nr:AAA family ATPase [Pseudomonas cyclaminis]